MEGFQAGQQEKAVDRAGSAAEAGVAEMEASEGRVPKPLPSPSGVCLLP